MATTSAFVMSSQLCLFFFSPFQASYRQSFTHSISVAALCIEILNESSGRDLQIKVATLTKLFSKHFSVFLYDEEKSISFTYKEKKRYGSILLFSELSTEIMTYDNFSEK